jgi:hypothetical protein
MGNLLSNESLLRPIEVVSITMVSEMAGEERRVSGNISSSFACVRLSMERELCP